MQQKDDSKITLRAFLLGLIFSALFAGITVYASDRLGMFPTATQIPVLPYVLLFASVLLINPLCRLVRVVRRFSHAEILIVFMMGLVSSGVSTFGLAAQLVPVVGGLFNRSWNTEQSQWNQHVVPFVDEGYFLAIPGLQSAARELLRTIEERNRTEEILQAADRTSRSSGPNVAAQWNALQSGRGDLPSDPVAALPLLRDELAQREAAVANARAAQQALETEAFAKVQAFRRGLPRGMRAYPGIIKLADDTAAGYFARVKRMLAGRGVTADLRAADKLLATTETFSESDRRALASALERVEERILTMSETGDLGVQIETLSQEQQALDARIAEQQAKLAELHRARREAPLSAMRRLEDDAVGAQRRLDRLRKRREALVKRREYVQQQFEMLGAGAGLIATIAEMKAVLQEGGQPEALRSGLDELRQGLPTLDGTLRRFLIGDVPWGDWLKPLARWALLIACTYLVLMAFNVLVFRQWAHNEKLIYPLAELPMALTGVGGSGGTVPVLFRTGLFWVGFAIPAVVLGYNILVATRLVPGLAPLDLDNSWVDYLKDTALEPLIGGRYPRSHIFFTMIGLAFLIPTKVSFSLWLFAILSMVQVIFLVAAGYGQNELSFSLDWWYTLNFRTAQGYGALIVFSSIVLYKCRAYLFCAFSPKTVEGLPFDERRELRSASFIFLGGSGLIVLLLWLGMGANPFHALFAWLVILIITIGLVRAVAEGGILGFQAFVSPFHAIRTLFGMNRAWTAPSLFAPIMVYYSVLFLDIKTFIAPAMANSLKIRDTLRMKRGRFHAAILLALALSVVVAVVMSIMLSYERGADLMQGWFYTHFPRQLYSNVANMARTPPEAAPGEALWMLGGGVGMALLMFFRQTAFWLPHPIGMIMLVNPLMGAYWFSIMLGWLFKSLVTKYGNKDTYARGRTLFIGLIAGELLMVAIGMFVGYLLDITIPVGLNKN